jgi:ketosteroid isomerase-like protein
MPEANVDIVRGQLEAYLAGDYETAKDFKVEVQDIVGADDRVLLVVRESGQGKQSGIELDRVPYVVFTLRNRKIVHWKAFVDHDEAVEAAGIRA